MHYINQNQEIYRPGTAISNASNLCTAVGGDQNKEFRGKTSIIGKGDNKIFRFTLRKPEIFPV